MFDDRMKCPFCSELIKSDAKKCRFCGEWLSEQEGPLKNTGPPNQVDVVEDHHEENHKEEVEAAEESFEIKPPKKNGSEYIKKDRRFPLLRIILFMAYIGIIGALICSELNAHRILSEARAEENAQNYQAAFELYSDIIDAFPFSFAVIKTHQGLQRLCVSHNFKMPRPSWLTPVEDVLGRESNVCEVYLLPFVTWPVCAILLALVFLTRILRPGTAFLVLLLLVAAVLGSVTQLSWYGRMLSEPMAKGIAEKPVVLYCASYALLVVTALLTLTSTRKSRHRYALKRKTVAEEH